MTPEISLPREAKKIYSYDTLTEHMRLQANRLGPVRGVFLVNIFCVMKMTGNSQRALR